MNNDNKSSTYVMDRKTLLALIEDMAKRWLAHDGLWFQAAEKAYGMEEAIRIDAAAWARFSPLEAERIMRFLKIPPKGGIPALKQALGLRLYAFVNKQEIIDIDRNRIVFRMNDCRVQSARKRKNMPDFPASPVGWLNTKALPGPSIPGSKPAASPAPRMTIPRNTTVPGSSGSSPDKVAVGDRPIRICTWSIPFRF